MIDTATVARLLAMQAVWEAEAWAVIAEIRALGG